MLIYAMTIFFCFQSSRTGLFLDKYIEEENERVKNSLNESSWFYCDYQTLAITRDKLCDGIRDCFDCTDEMNCSSPKVQFFFCFGGEYRA